MPPAEPACRALLAKLGQTHLLSHWDKLGPPARARLLAEIDAVDWDLLTALLTPPAKTPAAPVLSAPAAISAAAPDGPQRLAAARARGIELIEAGRVAALTVAGGQGTRLGFDGPKGCFAVMPLTGKTLFQHFAEGLAATGTRHGVDIPWYIMTSPENHDTTRDFLAAHDHFGARRVTLFTQGTMPAVDDHGRVLLAERDHLALAPDGHGGTLRALARSGTLAALQRDGVEYISYFQVDNPLVRPVDPTFIGLVDVDRSDVGSKAIRKAFDDEKVGVFVLRDGLLDVIEYSDMPRTLVQQRNADGSRTYDFANMAVHVFRVSFIADLVDGRTLTLPWHRARKKVPALDPVTGTRCEPTEPNAIKFEQFIFDAIPLAQRPLIYEVARSEEFSPVKNATGVDSPATTRQHLIERAQAWLAHCGAPTSGTVEISPLVAQDATELAAALAAGAVAHDVAGGVHYT